MAQKIFTKCFALLLGIISLSIASIVHAGSDTPSKEELRKGREKPYIYLDQCNLDDDRVIDLNKSKAYKITFNTKKGTCKVTKTNVDDEL